MKKLILVESITIGNFTFEAIILENKYGELCFSIYLNNLDEPMLTFYVIDQSNIGITVNEKCLDHVYINRTIEKTQRRKFFKKFYDFIITSEKKAAYMVFKDKKMNYIKDSEIIIDMKNRYIGS